MADFFDEKDIVSEGDFFDQADIEDEFSLEDEVDPNAPSIAEALGRGAVQGSTIGFADELGAAALSPLEQLRRQAAELIEGTPEHTDKMLRQQGFTGDVEAKDDLSEVYSELRDTTREANKEAEEVNPATFMAADIAGGIIPGIATGGGTAAAGVLKTGAKEAMKQAAKTGAKYGAVAGAGYSEADDLTGLVTDAALGAGTGAIAGVGLPLAAKGIKNTIKGAGKGLQKTLETLVPESEAIKAGYKYGRQGKAITQEVLDEDLAGISKNILKNIKADKDANNLKAVKEKLDALGYKVNTKQTVQEAIEDLEKLTKGDVLDLQNKDLLPKIKKLAGHDSQTEKLTERAKKAAIKKGVEAEGVSNQALIKAEKDLNKKALLTGDELDTITPYKKEVGGLDTPTEFTGIRGKFNTPEGSVYKDVVTDTTPYQPEMSKILGADGRPIIKTVDKGSGKISAIVGNVEDKIELNLKNMSISEVENLRKQLNLATKLAKAQGAMDDPIMQRAQKLAGDLKNLTDEAIKKTGNTELIGKRARFSDVFSAEELLGIDKRFAPRKDINELRKNITLGDKLGFEKGFKTRQEGNKALDLLGEKTVTPQMKQQLELLRKLNQISGRESQENISRAGIYKMAVGDLPNVAGRAVKKASDVSSKVTSPVKNAIDSLANMTRPQVDNLIAKYSTSDNQGVKFFGDQLKKAMSQEGAAQSQAIWAISQSAAFRELLKREIPEMEQQMEQDLGLESQEEVVEDEISREPAGAEDNAAILDHVLKVEAGYQAQPQDNGNYLDGKLIGTNKGITPKAYQSFYGKAPTVQDMKNLTKEQALEIYNKDYIEDPGFDDISDDYLKANLVDFGVNSGPRAAVKKLQKIIKVKPDGILGPDTLKKIQEYDGDLNSELFKGRRDHYKKTIERSPEKKIYEKGWENRLKGLEELKLPARDPAVEPVDQEAVEPEAPTQEEVSDIETAIDNVNQQQSSGDNTPVYQLDDLLAKIDNLRISEEDKDELGNDAVNMANFSDGNRLKELLRKISELK